MRTRKLSWRFVSRDTRDEFLPKLRQRPTKSFRFSPGRQRAFGSMKLPRRRCITNLEHRSFCRRVNTHSELIGRSQMENSLSIAKSNVSQTSTFQENRFVSFKKDCYSKVSLVVTIIVTRYTNLNNLLRNIYIFIGVLVRSTDGKRPIDWFKLRTVTSRRS